MWKQAQVEADLLGQALRLEAVCARHRQSIPAAVLEQIAPQTPTRRLATEDEVARLITFLASAANGSVTGTAVRVSGGLHM